MRAPSSSANIISAGLIAAAFGLLLLVVLAFLFGPPDRNDGGSAFATASQPLRAAEESVERAGEAVPLPPRAFRADAGTRGTGVDRQLVAGDRRELVTLDDFTREPLARAAEPVFLEPPPFMLDPVDLDPGDEIEAADAPQAGDAGSVNPEPPAMGAEALPPPAAVPEERGSAGQGGAAVDVNAAVERETCGTRLCPAGWVCCNESCGTCTEPGQSCSQLRCSMPAYPVSVSCGRNTCAVGEVCCNFSCGICADPGATCSQRVCD